MRAVYILLGVLVQVCWTLAREKRNGIPGVDLNALDNTYKESEKIKQMTDADFTDDLATWQASSTENQKFLEDNFPYYLAGYDRQNRPIWAAEFGKMDLRTVAERGGDLQEDFEHYVKQAAYRIHVSMRNRSADVNEILFLMDCSDMKMRQIAYIPVLKMIIKIVYTYRDLLNGHIGPSAMINTNFLAETLVRLVKPALGPAFAKIEVMGSKKRKWEPALKRIFGAENIPSWYGGTNKHYKAIAVYG